MMMMMMVVMMMMMMMMMMMLIMLADCLNRRPSRWCSCRRSATRRSLSPACWQ
jgi:hypothetical protein